MYSISVIGVFIFIFFAIICQWVLIYEPLDFYNKTIGQFYIFIYHILSALLIHSYWKSIITPPGSPDTNWIPEGKTSDDLKLLNEQFRAKSENHHTFSKSTTVYVDDDLTTITVQGFAQYVLLSSLLEQIIASNVTNVDDSLAAVKTPTKNKEEEIFFIIPDPLITVLFILNLSGLIPVFLGVLGLFFYQLEFILYNYTPVEKYPRKSQGKYARKNGFKFKWRYDRGFKQNFKDVFGDSPIYWFLSLGYPKSDGTYFKENEIYKNQQQKILETETKRLLSTSKNGASVDLEMEERDPVPYSGYIENV
ncbi:hypothetical protein DICPUDRAFT_148109 [Dictyostelium purpureum]|uniref:Protein S-acyltransferase n=1 Tax=Dictyostelium purpureum TaxID=5786 RepID=F0ZA99_DICPU|nr:uncharacterized protein DICPUDRAFT_148109 [Dictyostelium purpureum]EGC39111.1 hypothetical protein DICPUDRAFT_148109 [Dictyostelium purpureum]|eukprot:XP_003284363.1 hypothetical protein DICPUDRAFT_148109 [Dictyostelium purpureum]